MGEVIAQRQSLNVWAELQAMVRRLAEWTDDEPRREASKVPRRRESSRVMG